MTDHNQRLRATLQELHAELEALEQLDPEVRAQLQSAADEIDAKLGTVVADAFDSDTSNGDEQETLAGQLTDAARQFEGEHPTLAGIVQRIVTGLSQLGI